MELVGGSRSTLLSELAPSPRARLGGVSLRKLLSSRARHQRLRESCLSEEAQELRDGDTEGDATSAASSTTITPEDACNSTSSAPADTARPAESIARSPIRRSNTIGSSSAKDSGRDDATAEVTSPVPPSSIVSNTATAELSTSLSSVSRYEGDSCSEKDRGSVAEKDNSVTASSRTSSAATLTNGWYSPALSGVSAARVRGNKHSKETAHKRRPLRTSELSLTSNAQEMEMDYYDYEVNNAGAAPGSYLGMDPAFLVWIPPLEQGDIIQEIDEKPTPKYEELIPKMLFPDPGSNKESPENDQPSKLIYGNDQVTPHNLPMVITKSNIIHPLNFSISDLHKDSPNPQRRSHRDNSTVSIPMKDLSKVAHSPVPVHRKVTDKSEAEEANRIRKLSDLSDIKFADENSDYSNEIKFMDDDTPDSNKLSEELRV